MIARLRRLRWLAVLLVIASPGVGGQLLPLLHPCPVDMPWATGTMAGMPGMAEMAQGASPGSNHAPAHHACTCIGQCCAPAIAAPPQGVIATVAVDAPRHVRWPVIEARDEQILLVDRLPEKTAPPLT